MTDIYEPLINAKPEKNSCFSLRRGGVAGGTANLFSSTVGCGILGLPFAFYQSGLLLGMLVLLVAVVCLSVYYLILCWASDYTGEPTYVGIVDKLCGQKWRRITEASIILHSLGTLCAVQALLALLLISLLQAAGWESSAEYRSLVITAYNLVFIFMVIPEELSALRYLSGLAMLATMYIACVVVFETPIYLAASDVQSVPMARLSVELVDSFSLLIFAFDCSRAVSIVYSELQPRSLRRMYTVLILSMCITASLYTVIGSCGLLSQGEATDKIVIMRSGPNGEPASADLIMLIGRVSMTVVLLVAFPVHLSPLKLSMQQFLDGPSFRPNKFRYYAVTFGSLTFTYLLALFFTDAISYFKVVGGVFVTFTSCILPNLVYWKMNRSSQAYCLWAVTTCLTILGLASAVKTFL